MNLNPFTTENLRNIFKRLPKKTVSRVSPSQAKEVGDKLFVDWKKMTPKDLAYGMNIELEHESTLKSLGVTDILKAVAKIALDHYAENRQYYQKLKKVEAKK